MEPNTFYHVYNHANGSENLFKENENYRFFIQQWNKYISPLAETYAYCLMPNHIHFLVKIKEDEDILNLGGFENLQGLERSSKIISKKFSNLFNSYCKAFNKRYNRRGSLFVSNFKRKEITSDDYFRNVICYIHRNPIHHRFCKTLEEWPHSSYHYYLERKAIAPFGTTIVTYFDDKSNFIYCHQQKVEALELDCFID